MLIEEFPATEPPRGFTSQTQKINTTVKASLRLTKMQRMRTPEDYRRVYRSKQWGGSAHHTFNVMAIDAEAGSEVGTLGVTVSKKVSKLAVVRNRIKRQSKEFFRLRQHQLFNAQLVITAKTSCAAATVQERQQSLELLWEKILKWQRWHQKTRANERDKDIR